MPGRQYSQRDLEVPDRALLDLPPLWWKKPLRAIGWAGAIAFWLWLTILMETHADHNIIPDQDDEPDEVQCVAGACMAVDIAKP